MTAIPQDGVARGVGIETEYQDLRNQKVQLLPQRIALIGQTNDNVDIDPFKIRIFSAAQAGQLFGFGSPLHLSAKVLFPINGDGVGSIPVTAYPVQAVDENGLWQPSIIELGGVGTQLNDGIYFIEINNKRSLEFKIEKDQVFADVADSIVDAVNAIIDFPVTAFYNVLDNVIEYTSKFSGYVAAQIWLTVGGAAEDGITFTFALDQAGEGELDISIALLQFAESWETIVVNAAFSAQLVAGEPPTVTPRTLDEIQTFGESRWSPQIRKPFVSFYGLTTEICGLGKVESATIITAERVTDRVNVQATAPCCFIDPFADISADLYFEIASDFARRVAQQANDNPPVDYAGAVLDEIFVAPDFFQYNYDERDAIVKGGASTVESHNNQVVMSDTVTPYSPEGETPPAYRFVVDIMKIMNIIYNLDLIFDSPNWKGKVLVPDSAITTNPDARKPKDAKSAIAAMADGLGLLAIIVDPDYTKANTSASIDSGNPKRLNIRLLSKLSGNTGILSIANDFGFNFG